jgi:hypothetical protein
MLCVTLLSCVFAFQDGTRLVLDHHDDASSLRAFGTQLDADNRRVQNAILRFHGIDYTDPRVAGPIEQRERLLLRTITGGAAQPQLLAAGIAAFSSLTVAIAHAPRAVRVIFTGPAWLGPAILPDGGMGAGGGLRW